MATTQQPLNPYIAGRAVGGECGFFGRQDVLREVERTLTSPDQNALVLFGQRRIGKTSILLQLERRLPSPPFVPVYFDLMDKARLPLDRVLYELAATAAPSVGVLPSAEAEFKDGDDAFRHAFIPAAYEALGEERRLVFLFDEFDVLDVAAEEKLPDTAAARAFFPYLRGLMAGEPRLGFVFVVGRKTDELSTDFLATFKAARYRRVSVLKLEAARELITLAQREGSLNFTDGAIERILTLTASHPYFTQLLCQILFDLAYDAEPEDVPTVDVDDVEASVPDVLEAGNNAFEWVWDGLPPAERIIFSAIATHTDEAAVLTEDEVMATLQDAGIRILIKELALAPRTLVDWEMLKEADGGYRFFVELMRRWVAAQKPLDRVKDELDRVIPLADMLYQSGSSFYRMSQIESALGQLHQALGINPNHLKARLLLGTILREQEKLEEAVQEFETAYRYDEVEGRYALVRTLLQWGETLEREGREGRALTAYDRALEISPRERVAQERRAAIWTGRGGAALDRDDLVTALAAYREAGNAEKIAQVEVLQRRQELAALESEALTHARVERWAEAIPVYEQLVTQAPDEESRAAWEAALEWCRAEEELARLFAEGVGALEQEDWKQAQRAFLEVITRRTDYRRGGRWATELLDQAAKAGPSIPSPVPPPFLPLVPKPAPAISPETADQVAQLACWGKRVMEVAYAPGGRLLAVASSVGIYLYDARTLAEVRFIETDTRVSSVAFSPDGATLASGLGDKTVQLWRVGDGTLLRALEGHKSYVWSVAFSPNGALLASGSGDKTVRLWQVEDGTLLRTLKEHTGSVHSVAFSPDGALLASGSRDDKVRLWRVADGRLLHTLEGHAAWVRSVAFSSDGATLASGADDKTVQLWRVKDGVLLHTLKGHTGVVRRVAFSSDGTLLASGSGDKSVRLWQVEDGTLLHTLKGHTRSVTSVAFSPDSATLVSGSYGETVWLWRVSDGTLLHTLEEHTGVVRSVAFSPDGATLALGSENNPVQLWRVEDGVLLHTLEGRTTWVRSVAFSPDGATLASGAWGNTVQLWRVADGTLLRTLKGHTDWVRSVAFSPDGALLASGAGDNPVRLWRVDDGTLLRTLKEHTGSVHSVAFSPDGALLASGAGDKTVRLWQVNDGTLLRTLKEHTGSVHSVAFSPDGALLASGAWDDKVRLWRVDDGTLLRTLKEHTSSVDSVAFSLDGVLLASGAWDKTVRLWRVKDGAPLRTLKRHTDWVRSVAFSPDGTLLASGSEDRTVRLWGVVRD